MTFYDRRGTGVCVLYEKRSAVEAIMEGRSQP